MNITCDYIKEIFPTTLHMCKGLIYGCKAKKLNQQWVLIVKVMYFLLFLFVLGMIHLFEFFEKKKDDAPTPILGPIVYTLAM